MKSYRHFLLFAIVLVLAACAAPILHRGAGQGGPPEINAAAIPPGDPEPQARRGFAPVDAKTPGDVKFTVLFFNDLHGNLNPFKMKKGDGTSVEVGGIARISALVKEIREENGKKGIKTFLLVAGDLLQGTPISTVFRGKPDIEIFNEMGVGAMTVGNHEFDFGLDHFLALKKMAAFPIISSNLVWKGTRRLMNEAYAAFPLSENATFTVIGATTMDLLTTTTPAHVEQIDVLDSISTVTENVARAAPMGPVILLSHSSFRTDSDIAVANAGLAAIIGGHDHLHLDQHRTIAGVPLFQASENGRYLGRLDMTYDPKSGKCAIGGSAYIPIVAELKPDPEVVKRLAVYNAKLDAAFRQVVGEMLVFMDGERTRIRYEETNLGDFVAGLMQEHTGSDAALINAGSFRSSLEKGPVTMEEIFRCMPYPNEIIVVTLTGREILETLNRSVRGRREDADGGFLQVSGVRFKIRGKTVDEVWIGGSALNPEKTYSVAVTDFIHDGGDGYKILLNKPATRTGLPLRELLVETIRKRGEIGAGVDGRIARE